MEKIKQVLNKGISPIWAIAAIVIVAVLVATAFLVYGYFWTPEQPENAGPGKVQEIPLQSEMQNVQFDDTQTRYSIKNLRSKIEIYVSMLPTNKFLDYGYEGISCDIDENISAACREVKTFAKKEPIIKTSKNAYCIYIKLLNGNYFCLDSRSGFDSETSTDPTNTGYCTGTTFICPEKSFQEIIALNSLYNNLLRSELIKNGWVSVYPDHYEYESGTIINQTPISAKYHEISHCGSGSNPICSIDFEKNKQKLHLNLINKNNEWVIVGFE